jgi:D-alanyl-lipoteichoic acid acyltransferase DltB (MBOAT superfamily)
VFPLLTPRTTPSPRAPHQRFTELVRAHITPRSPAQPPPPHHGLYHGEPPTCQRHLPTFLVIFAHLALLIALIRIYRIEGRALFNLGNLLLIAVPIHYLLPYHWKRPALAAFGLLALSGVFGPILTALVATAALTLLAIARANWPWSLRALTLIAIASTAALARAGLIPSPVPDLVWPVLASLVMFRLIIYMYELKHARHPEPLSDSLAYLFLPPNACFLHFPVVDYRTFCRGFLARDIHSIQRAGLAMMTRGILHLLLYRLVYHRLLIAPTDVHSPATLAIYLFTNYLLYLRVSGQFHLACGILHLFGYQLPETHHHYLLATGFTDYWRRINIYWKDFMVRVVFNPVVFRLKRWPRQAALLTATAIVFLTTWALHGYQAFWLRGSWGFSLPDALFWAILGSLVMVNVLHDARRKPAARAALLARTPKALALRSLKIAGTLTTICLLWSLWSSPSLAEWLALFQRAFA